MSKYSMSKLFFDLGVNHGFGMPADSVNGVYDELASSKQINLYTVYNEKAGASAAIIVSLLTRKPAVCIATAGPGVGHILQSAVYARHARARVIFIVGLSANDGYRGMFQDVNIDLFCRSVGIPFIDLRKDDSKDVAELLRDGPIFLGVTASFPSHSSEEGVGRRANSAYVNDNLDSPRGCLPRSVALFSESLINPDDYLHRAVRSSTEQSMPRPSGWGAGALIAGLVLGREVISSISIAEEDFLESFADATTALLSMTAQVKLVLLSGSSSLRYDELCLRHPNLVLVECSFRGQASADPGVRFSLEEEDTWLTDHHGITNESLAFEYAGFTRMGKRLRVEVYDPYLALSSYNGMADQVADHAQITASFSVDAPHASLIGFWKDLFEAPRKQSKSVLGDRSKILLDNIPRQKRMLVIAGSKAIPYAEHVIEQAEAHEIALACTLGSYWAFKHSQNYVGIVGSSGHFVTEKLRSKATLCVYLGVSNQGIAHDVLNPDFPHVDVLIETDDHDRPFATNALSISLEELDMLFGKQITGQEFYRKAVSEAHSKAVNPGPRFSERFSRYRARLSARQVIRESLSHFDPENTVIFVDVGLNTLWCIRSIPAKYKVIWTRGFASMGAATFSGIATAKRTNLEVLVITGDGGFALASGEVIASQNLMGSCRILVLDNGGLGAVRYEQEILGYAPVEVINGNRYLKYLKLQLGCNLTFVDSVSELHQNIAITERGISVVNVFVDPDEAPVPARDISSASRRTLIKSWLRQGKRGLVRAFRTMPYVIDKWER